MNSGCYDNDISKVLISVTALDKKTDRNRDQKRRYKIYLQRGTNLPKI